MMGAGHALFVKEQNRGTNGSPGNPEKLHYKRRGWVVKKGRERKKEKETQKRRNSLGKTIRKIFAERKTLREKRILLPGIL